MSDLTSPDDLARKAGAKNARAARAIRIWLYVMCALIGLMVAVGGATRLTDSGLSITEWRPVTGAVPPLSAEAWDAEFSKYKQIPEYERVNAGMTLNDFKVIYWWEWGHRLLGRVIGVAFLVPMVWFIAAGAARGALAWKLGGLFLLGGAQGALGWFMVMSGLVDRVDVSQYRLAAHLGLAVLIFASILWVARGLKPRPPHASVPNGFVWGAAALAAGTFIQMLLGAFVAGLRAGRTYNTWPLMDGRFVPEGYFAGAPRFGDAFETLAAVQFNHRIGAYLLFAGAAAYWIAALRTRPGDAIAQRAGLMFAVVSAQALLGVWTLLAATPLELGLAHQLGALGVFAIAVWNAEALYSGRSRGGAGASNLSLAGASSSRVGA